MARSVGASQAARPVNARGPGGVTSRASSSTSTTPGWQASIRPFHRTARPRPRLVVTPFRRSGNRTTPGALAESGWKGSTRSYHVTMPRYRAPLATGRRHGSPHLSVSMCAGTTRTGAQCFAWKTHGCGNFCRAHVDQAAQAFLDEVAAATPPGPWPPDTPEQMAERAEWMPAMQALQMESLLRD